MLSVPPSLQRRALEVEGWFELGCAETALRKVEPLLAVPGARPLGLFLRVRALVALERHAEALADLQTVRNLPHDPEWLELTEAWCQKRLDNLPAAAACMERLIERRSRCAIGHFNLGCYLALLGDSKRALAEVTVACGLDPAFRGEPLDDPDLHSLHGLPEFDALRASRD